MGARSAGRRSDPSTVLRDMCRAFASAVDADAAAASTVRLARRVVQDPGATVRILLLDHLDRLRTSIVDGDLPDVGSRRSTARRRTALAGEPTRLVWVTGRPGLGLATLPMTSGAEAVGVLEVVAPFDRIEAGWGSLEALAGLAALFFSGVRARTAARRDVDALVGEAALLRSLLRVRSREGVALTAQRFCFARFELPIASWVRTGVGPELTLMGAAGLGRKARIDLRTTIGRLTEWSSHPKAEARSLVEAFARIAGADDAMAIDAGDVVLMVARAGDRSRYLDAVLAPMLREVLGHLAVVTQAERRNRHLDLSLSLTAHEVRGPLLGARVTIERLLAEGAGEPLSRVRRELDELAGLIDPLLLWSAGSAPLRRRPVDLAGVIRRVVSSSEFDQARGRLTLSAPGRVMVSADPALVQLALANLIRNAVSYSPQGEAVRVEAGVRGTEAAIRVMDRGPGVVPGEEEAIFDPLARGGAGAGRDGGRGLGLFLARRIIEEHAGRLWVEPEPDGATFQVRLPALPRRAGRPPSVHAAVRASDDAGTGSAALAHRAE